MRNWAIAVIGAILVAFGGWYFASPGLALRSLKAAAVEGDTAALREQIDFPSLRESLKTQLRAKLAAEITSKKDDNPFGKLGAVLAMGMVDGMVEGFITPEALRELVLQRKRESANSNENLGTSRAEGKELDWEIERDGLDRFYLLPGRSKDEKGPKLIFERSGISWKLSGIDLSEDQLAD